MSDLKEAYNILREEIMPLNKESTPEEFEIALPILADTVQYLPLNLVYNPKGPFFQVSLYFINSMIHIMGMDAVSNRIRNLEAPLGSREYLGQFIRLRERVSSEEIIE